jgi:DNA-binding transcriptional ArsR family regulator
MVTSPRRTACVCADVVEGLPRAPSTVSQQLEVLGEAGLAKGESDGPRVRRCDEPRTLRRRKSRVGIH